MSQEIGFGLFWLTIMNVGVKLSLFKTSNYKREHRKIPSNLIQSFISFPSNTKKQTKKMKGKGKSSELSL